MKKPSDLKFIVLITILFVTIIVFPFCLSFRSHETYNLLEYGETDYQVHFQLKNHFKGFLPSELPSDALYYHYNFRADLDFPFGMILHFIIPEEESDRFVSQPFFVINLQTDFSNNPNKYYEEHLRIQNLCQTSPKKQDGKEIFIGKTWDLGAAYYLDDFVMDGVEMDFEFAIFDPSDYSVEYLVAHVGDVEGLPKDAAIIRILQMIYQPFIP